MGVPDAAGQLANEPSTVLERAAVLPRPAPRSQQLVEQIAVALLQIDEVEADSVCTIGRGRVTVLQPVELVVGHEMIVRGSRPPGRLINDRERIEQWVVLGQDRAMA